MTEGEKTTKQRSTVENSGDGTVVEGWIGTLVVRGMDPKKEHASFIQEQVAMLVISPTVILV